MPRERKLPSGMWKRGSVYYARFRCQGELVRQKLSTDFRVACEMLTDLRLGTYRRGQGDISNDVEIAGLAEDWLRSVKQTLKSSTIRRYEQNVEHVKRLLAVKQVSQLNMDVVEAFRRDRLTESVEPQTVNKDLNALRTMLNWAVERRKIGSNPIAVVKPLPADPKEARALRPEEVQRLLDAATPHWRKIWYAYLTTGLRKMELAHLLFSDIDWHARELIVRSTSAKTKTERRVPLDDELYHMIAEQQNQAPSREPGTWADATTTGQIRERLTFIHVFTTGANTPLGGNIYREFMATCARAGIETATRDALGHVVEFVDLHSTRHTFATDLILNGADPKTVQTLLGHKTLEMTMRVYAKVFTSHKHAAIGKLSYGGGVKHNPAVLPLPRRA